MQESLTEKVAAIVDSKTPESLPCDLGPALIRRSDDDTETPLRVEPTPQSEIVGDIIFRTRKSSRCWVASRVVAPNTRMCLSKGI